MRIRARSSPCSSTRSRSSTFYAVLTPVLKALVKKMGMENWKGRVFVCSILFYNCTLVGFPVLNEIYGKLGLLCAVISSMVYNAFFYT